MIAPFIILGGIYTGLFTPTESAIVAIFYTLFVGIALHRELTLEKTLAALRTTTWITGRVLLILFTATAFGRLLVEQRIPADIAESLLHLTSNIYLIWALVIAFLIFVGMFMETLAAILILVPVLLPVMYSVGADPTHVGIVVICVLSVGFQTPPLGENLFVASGVSGETVERIVVRVMPFVRGLDRCGVHHRVLSEVVALAAGVVQVLTRPAAAAASAVISAIASPSTRMPASIARRRSTGSPGACSPPAAARP